MPEPAGAGMRRMVTCGAGVEADAVEVQRGMDGVLELGFGGQEQLSMSSADEGYTRVERGSVANLPQCVHRRVRVVEMTGERG